ncbi:MAG: hypothetical protein RL391_79 [Actinomycetota bacterium]|jgi:hypothetical protein
MKERTIAGLGVLALVIAGGCGGRDEPKLLEAVDPGAVLQRPVFTSEPPPADPGPIETSIETAFAQIVSRRVECGRSPRTCDPDRLAVPGSDVHRSLVELMADRVANGVIASTDGSLRYRIDNVTPTTIDTALVRVCFTDDTVLVQPVPSADGEPIAPIVVDDSTFSAVADWELRRIDGEWLWSAEHSLNWSVGEDLCVG